MSTDLKKCGTIIPNCKWLSNSDSTDCATCNTTFFSDGTLKACISNTANCGTGFFGNGIASGVGAACISDTDNCYTGYFNDGSDENCISNTANCDDGFFGNGI